MDRNARDAIIEEDFNWLKAIKVVEIDGKPMLATENSEVPFNVETVMYEAEFIRKWMMGFALGNYHGINYFNMEGWCAMTGNGTRSVMVVDVNHKPVLLIPPLISHNLSQKDFELLRAASIYLQVNNANLQNANNPNANIEMARKITERLKETKRRTLTELVSPEYFEKHGIVPEVEQQVYYVKDNINGNKAPIKEINELRVILYKNYRGEQITDEERELVNRLSRGSFTFKEEVKKETEKVNDGPGNAVNPLEC